jgi:hypothetical protein
MRLLIWKYMTLVCLAGLLQACKKEPFTTCCFIDDEDPMVIDTTTESPPCWDEIIVAQKDSVYTQFFRLNGPGWTGADGTLSIPFPDGRTLWLFGDTFLGTVEPDLSRRNFTFVNNTALVQSGQVFSNPVVGNQPFARPEENGWWYWPGHGHVVNDTLEIIWYAMYQPGEGMWGFDYAAIDIIRYSVLDLKMIDRKRVSTFPKINFGTCILSTQDYTYIYGAEKNGLSKHLHVARVPRGTLTAEWQYFDGQTWINDLAKSRRQIPNVSEQFKVFEQDGIFYLLTQHHVLGSEIYIFDSDHPHTGFNNRKLIYCTPETKGEVFTYNAFAHPHLSQGNQLLISYNVNSFQFQDVLKNADLYRPKFVHITGWKR